VIRQLFLYSYESAFLQKLVKDKKIHETRAFNFTYRYVDDVVSINNSRFTEFLPLIYPPELWKLKRPQIQLRPHHFWTYTSNLTTCREVIYFDKILVSEYKLFKRSNEANLFIALVQKPVSQMKMTFQEIIIIATGPCIANHLRDVSTICRRSWYIGEHIWKIYDFKIEVVPFIINFSTELTTVVKFEVLLF
jgi:hypothetical protein